MSRDGQAGFTLLEVLLSVTILALLAGLSLPVYASFQSRNDIDLTTQSIAFALRRAETYSRAVTGDSQWGVEIQSNAAILFKGAVFAGRDTSFDENIPLSSTISRSGLSEVVFTKFTAAPSATGTITLVSGSSNDTRTITINAKGMVNY